MQGKLLKWNEFLSFPHSQSDKNLVFQRFHLGGLIIRLMVIALGVQYAVYDQMRGMLHNRDRLLLRLTQ
jgi:hypothetical protein